MDHKRDLELIGLYQARSEDAVSETRKTYGRLIYSVVLDMLGNRSDADECENDTYLGLWNSIPPEQPDNLKAYCLKIARNQALKRISYNSAVKRKRFRTVSYEEILGELEELTNQNGMEQDVFTEVLNDFLEELQDQDRKVFVSRYWYMLSVKEISSGYQMTESRVKSILFRTRKKLRIYLSERGYHYE